MTKEAVQPTFSQKNGKLLVDFWVTFGSILGCEIASKMDPLQNKEDFGPPGGPQGASRVMGGFWKPLGSIFEGSVGHLGCIFEVQQQQKKQKEAHQTKAQ